ncbi:hypothetical protein D0T08_00180 [Emticicia sp. C21]|nr:hypothetical protein D0T08_00180 [Emticicia sp. C21]
MRIILTVLQGIAFVLLALQLLWWFMAIGSGHQIPQKTTNIFSINVIILIVIIIGLFFWKRSRKSTD